jgi:hypothetical protein
MSEPILDPELSALEQALARLEPRSSVSREAVLFRAGQASARRNWPWAAATCVSSLAVLVLGWVLWNRPEPQTIVERIVVHVERPAPAPLPVLTQPGSPGPSTESPEPGAFDYLRQRREVLYWGVEALRPLPPQESSEGLLTPAATPRLADTPGRAGL